MNPRHRNFLQTPLHRPIALVIIIVDANATDQHPRNRPALLEPHRGKAGDVRPHRGAGNLVARPPRTPPGCPRRTRLGRIHPPHLLRNRTLGVHRGGNPTPPPFPLAHRPRPEPRHASPRPYHVHRPVGPRPRSASGLRIHLENIPNLRAKRERAESMTHVQKGLAMFTTSYIFSASSVRSPKDRGRPKRKRARARCRRCHPTDRLGLHQRRD